MRALGITGLVVAAVIAIAALLLAIGIPAGFLTSAITAQIERATGSRMTVAGASRIALWPSPRLTLNDVTLGDPAAGDGRGHATVGRIEADMTLASLWSGHPEITALTIARPVLSVPLLRQRIAQPNSPVRPAASPPTTDTNTVAIDRVTVSDGTISLFNLHDHVDDRIEGLNADAVIGSDRNIAVTGRAHVGEHPLTFNIKATSPFERQIMPVEMTLEAPGLLQGPLSAKAELRHNAAVILINGLSGALGDGTFNGWASVDLAGKPLVKLDLDFQKLGVAPFGDSATPASQPPGTQSWSNVSFDLSGLNYVDLQARISAAELNIGDLHLAPAAIDAALESGVLKCRFANLGAYDGQANGDLTVDVSGDTPAYALRSDLTGVRALPLLRGLAGFDKLDGRLQAKLALHSSGTSQRAIMSNVDGTVFAVFQDGALRGLNVAAMIHALASGTLSGWQEQKQQATDLTQLAASFRVDKGQAATTDLNLVGPLVRVTGAGTINLPEKSLAFRVEPKLVMTTEGQGRSGDPVGLGIPVVINGPWAEPRIYPDVAGILDNPDAAYDKLKALGKGLFGTNAGPGEPGGTGSGDSGAGDGGGASDQLGKLGETLGKLIQQGLSRSRSQPPASTTPPPASPQSDPVPESQPMNDIMKQLFSR
jgi:AsmA protein